MKKLLIAGIAALTLVLTPVVASAECYPIDGPNGIHATVAEWDQNAKWETITEGVQYERLLAWEVLQGLPEQEASLVKGIVVLHATSGSEGKIVVVAVTADNQCVDYSHRMTEEQYNAILQGQ